MGRHGVACHPRRPCDHDDGFQGGERVFCVSLTLTPLPPIPRAGGSEEQASNCKQGLCE